MLTQLGNFRVNTAITFGRGGISQLGELARDLGSSTFLLVADPALESVGSIALALESLEKAGLKGETFTDLEPEPYLDGADAAAELGIQREADLVIGLGGGSAMDTAKAAAALVTNGGKAQDYLGLNKVGLPGLPTIMVPTTAGTGAEVTFTAVFTNRQTSSKAGINSPFLFPQIALLDPELTVSLPADVTAATGMDALTHAIESVTSRSCTPFTEALALAAVRLIGENLRRAVFRGEDIQARENMLYGSLLAGLALADAGVGAAHALAYPLGGKYRISHGLANAMLIPSVMEFNLPAAERHFAMIAKSMGEPVDGLPVRRAADAAVEAVSTLCSDIGIPCFLSDLGIPRSDISALADVALTVTRPVENNPRVLGKDEAIMIYEQLFC